MLKTTAVGLVGACVGLGFAGCGGSGGGEQQLLTWRDVRREFAAEGIHLHPWVAYLHAGPSVRKIRAAIARLRRSAQG